MITPVCDICGEDMKEFGALIFSPPIIDQVVKQHICIHCYISKIIPLLKASRTYKQNFSKASEATVDGQLALN